MLISFLQHQRKEAESVRARARLCAAQSSNSVSLTHPTATTHPQDGSHRSWNLGTLFLGFLRLYGVDFNYEETGISVLSEGAWWGVGRGPVVDCWRAFGGRINGSLDPSTHLRRPVLPQDGARDVCLRPALPPRHREPPRHQRRRRPVRCVPLVCMCVHCVPDWHAHPSTLLNRKQKPPHTRKTATPTTSPPSAWPSPRPTPACTTSFSTRPPVRKPVHLSPLHTHNARA